MNRCSVPEHCNLHFDRPIALWDEAIPLGSGLTGCLIYGDGAPLKLSLDRGDLWDCRPAPEVLDENYTYEELIRLVRAGDQQGILDRFDDFYSRYPYPTKLPAGNLQLYFDAPTGVKSTLSLQRAEGEVTVQTAGGDCRISAFLSAKNQFGYLKMEGVLPNVQLFTHDFTSPEVEEKYSLNFNSTKKMQYAPAEEISVGNVRGRVQAIPDGGFALLYAEKSTETGREAVYYIPCSRDGEGWLEKAAAAVESALKQGYDAALQDHLAWWEGFWKKSAVTLPDKELEKQWYLSHYYLGSCSRKGFYPMPLQGVWTADSGHLPPWKGDYHGDLNLQFSYYSSLKSDHLEECECFLDFFTRRNCTAGRRFAETFFDAPGGACMPSVFAFDGTSLGGWPMYATTITNQIWELHVYYQYYKYTGNETFLAETLLPQLKECETVVRRWLAEDENGRLVLPLSSSPEINDNEITSWLPHISNYDLALLRFLYLALVEFTDDESYPGILARLPDYAADESGYQICEGMPLNISHRHFSHLMQAFPLDIVDWADPKDRALVETSVNHLKDLGPEWWVGFSFTWMADLDARLGNGESAVKQLKLLVRHLYSPNGFHLNGDQLKSGLTRHHYRPFTLETNMMFAESVQEMLMQCYDGVIRVFPAVPEQWMEDCSFDGLLAYGNVKVSASAQGGRVQSVTLYARNGGSVRFLNPFTGKEETYEMTKDEVKTIQA